MSTGYANMEMEVDFSAIEGLIGAVYGMAHSMTSDQYEQGLLNVAHVRSAKKFNQAAAAMAAAGKFKHMYEYGVAGITEGHTIGDPTSREARLFEHSAHFNGDTMNVGFNYRTAVMPNPKPTTQNTGVSAEELSKLGNKKYVFYNKAMIIETGANVNISPKDSRYLFIPFYGKPAANPSNTKGFAMSSSEVSFAPGKSSKGQFTKFWTAWWSGKGFEIISKSVIEDFSKDVERSIKLAKIHSGELKPAGRSGSRTIAQASAAVRTGMKNSIRYRQGVSIK